MMPGAQNKLEAKTKSLSTSGMMIGLADGDSQPPLQLAFNRIDLAISNMSGAAESLADRIGPVLGSPRPQPEREKVRGGYAGDSMVSNTANEYADRIDRVTARLLELLERIEL